MELSKEDIDQIQSHGLSRDQVEDQLRKLRSGKKFTKLQRACKLDDGILKLMTAEASDFVARYETQSRELECIKFVPASGAATRMFRDLYNYLNSEEANEHTERFFEHLQKFPFFSQLPGHLRVGELGGRKVPSEKYNSIIRYLLEVDGLNFGNSPKGLIPFHEYEHDLRTAFEEHLFEGQKYLPKNGHYKLHFTVTNDYESRISSHLNERAHDVQLSPYDFEFSYSHQEKSTDTIAIDEDGKLARDDEGKLIFRPGGHGALLENLNALDADIIFIKNIDNVVHEFHCEPTIFWKKALAGYLLDLRSEIFKLMKALKEDASGKTADQATEFFEGKMGIEVSLSENESNRAELLRDLLDRPLRVCGMVRSQGEPGGGPFWVKDKTGLTRPQIVEGAQVDLQDPDQKQVFESSTHFNPVDLVCSVKKPDGSKYDLKEYVDEEAYFISEKSKEGKSLKALEHPGLWNGAMAQWNTVFVEVPVETFSSVKTVNDLLKPLHQPK